MKYTTEYSIRKSKHSTHKTQPLPNAILLKAGQDPRQAMDTNVRIKKLASIRVKSKRKTHDVQYCAQNHILLILTDNYTLLFIIFKKFHISTKRLFQSIALFYVGPLREDCHTSLLCALNKKKFKLTFSVVVIHMDL